jgi:zinc transport system substrate-binding protein
MEVAVARVRVVERARDLVVDVVPVGNRRVPAGGTVGVAALYRRAGFGTAAVHVEAVLVGVVFVRRVEVAVVQVVHMVFVRHRPVAAVGSVYVPVALVFPAGHDPSAAEHRLPATPPASTSSMEPMQSSAGTIAAALLAVSVGARADTPGRVAAATIAPLASLTESVAGPGWQVRTIVPPGVSPHVFEPTPRDVKALAPALLVVTVGAGYDGWAEKLVRACASKAVVHDAGASVGVAEDSTGDHDGEIGKDPHWWLSPRLAARALSPLAERFASLDPAGAEGYRARARQAAAGLAALDAEVAAVLAPVKGRPVVSAHNAWTYFLADYGLVNAGSIEPVPGREPSPRELRAIIDTARSQGLSALFTEPQFSPSVAKVVAGDAGVRVALVDPIGGVPGRRDYADLMRFNARSFREALEAR